VDQPQSLSVIETRARYVPYRRLRAPGKLAGLLRLSAQIICSGAAPD
jgi:hypothetical protein